MPEMNLGTTVFFLILAGTFALLPNNLGWAMLPDCVEYGEWKFGIRGEGTVSSSLTFINKLGMAIGGSLAGLLLAMSGYVANQPQTAEVVETIRFMKFVFPILGYICSLISMCFYDITNEKYKMILAELRQRKEK